MDEPVDCWLPAQTAVQSRRLTLKILDRGKPLTNVWIRLVPILGGEAREGATAQDGVVEFGTLPNGPYLVVRESMPVAIKSVLHDSHCVTSVELDFSDRK
jgi:hypothetical protein